MDFKKWNEQAHEADNFLDTLGKTLWKRKWLLLFLGFCWVVYWAFTQPDLPEEEYPNSEMSEDGTYGGYYEDTSAFYEEVK